MSRGHVSVLLGVVLMSACVEQEEDKPSAEDEQYIKKNLLSAAPAPQLSVNADLDGKVTFLGADISPNPAEAGKDVKLVTYWKVVAPPGEGWRMFMHVNGPNRQGFINIDHGPIRGKYPVARWKAGDIIKDEHAFRIPPTWQHDTFELYVGLFKRGGGGFQNMEVKAGPKDNLNRVLVATVPVKGKAAPPAPKRYVARKTAKPIKVDGKLDDPAWKTAPSTGLFVDTMSGAPSAVQTEAKILWDDENLYLAFDNKDSDVWAQLTNRDDKLWTQEAVEVMIDADGNGKTYVEFQVAPNGNVFDTYLPEYRKYEDAVDPKRKPYDWNSKIKAKVVVDGTLNERDDTDKGWVAEIAIPLGDVKGLGPAGAKVPPALGDVWRLNMYRLDVPKDKNGVAAGWSPPMVGDFHALDKFGEVLFADPKGEVPPPAVAAKPEDRKAALENALSGVPGEASGKAGRKLTAGKNKKPTAEEKK